jgi:hypothetical protein
LSAVIRASREQMERREAIRFYYRLQRQRVGWSCALLRTALDLGLGQDEIKRALGWVR